MSLESMLLLLSYVSVVGDLINFVKVAMWLAKFSLAQSWDSALWQFACWCHLCCETGVMFSLRFFIGCVGCFQDSVCCVTIVVCLEGRLGGVNDHASGFSLLLLMTISSMKCLHEGTTVGLVTTSTVLVAFYLIDFILGT